MTSVVMRSALGIVVGLTLLAIAMTAALLLRAVDHLWRGLAAAHRRLDDLRSKIDRIEQVAATLTSRARDDDAGPRARDDANVLVDLAAAGRAGPAGITAATLDRSRFPRLAVLMTDDPPAGMEPPHAASDSIASSTREALPASDGAMPPLRVDLLDSVASRNLMQTWAVAMRNGDVGTCRRVLSVMLDTADVEQVDRMRRDFVALEDRTEEALRGRFAECVARRDIAAILEVGAKICELLPDRPVAAEFRRLAPHLARARPQGSQSPATFLPAREDQEAGRGYRTAGS